MYINNKKIEISLNYIIDSINIKNNEIEWGFPKGRRNVGESDLHCAQREFNEETNYTEQDYILFKNLSAYEVFVGSNNICYKHIYFIGKFISDKNPIILESNKSQMEEIGDIRWLTKEECIKNIKSYHSQKKLIINWLFNKINKFNLT